MAAELKGKSALVTGSDRGIGKGIAIELARAGCRVAVNYHLEPSLANETVGVLTSMGVDAFAVKGDVSDSASVRAMFAAVIERFGRIDIHVNNAGVQTWKPLLEVTEDEWDLVIDTNLKGCFLCTQAAARHMKDYGGGAIVNIGSGCNKLAFPDLVAYTASKGGIEMFTKVAAVELGTYGIRVNCVAPGAVEVERTRLEDPDYAGTWGRITPLGRVGYPADIGRAVCYMAGPDSEFVTGQTLWIDGGMYARAPWAYRDQGSKP
jgi:NAD(P)-dependent dehydrogenase (short-subunit alcohol dehydrogenase family)